MKQLINITALSLLVTLMPAMADTPPIQVTSDLQASRDSEKLTILHNELNDQLKLATQLQQQRAMHLQSGKAEEVNQTEIRLAEVNENILQLQQEIQLASGQPAMAQAVTVSLVPPSRKTEKTKRKQENEQVTHQQEPWWDLYHQGKQE